MTNHVDCNGRLLSLNPILDKEARKKIDREIRREFAERLRAARKASGLTQDELAARVVGIKRAAYGAYESGRAEPPASMLVRLARALYRTPQMSYRDFNPPTGVFFIGTTAGTNRVCPRCLPLKGKVVGYTDEDSVQIPPLHPRCRCVIDYREVGERGLAAGNIDIKTSEGSSPK